MNAISYHASSFCLSPFLPFETSAPDVVSESNVTEQIGTEGLLPCRTEGNPVAVDWQKGEHPANAQQLMYYHYNNDKWLKEGAGYSAGIYDMNINFSLIIKDVTVENSGRYFCNVFDEETGQIFTEYTYLEVIGKYGRILTAVHLCIY